MEAVHADWKEYLNLLICEENHLKHMEEYHKVKKGLWYTHKNTQYLQFGKAYHVWMSAQFHKEARDTQDLLKRLEKELDQKYNPEFKDMYQMEGLIMEIDVSITRSKSINQLIYSRLLNPMACLGPSQGHGAHWRTHQGSSEAESAGFTSALPPRNPTKDAACGGSVWIWHRWGRSCIVKC